MHSPLSTDKRAITRSASASAFKVCLGDILSDPSRCRTSCPLVLLEEGIVETSIGFALCESGGGQGPRAPQLGRLRRETN